MEYQASQGIEQTILEAARRLFQEQGQASFTMQELAQASGVSRATIYRQIGSREALLEKLAADQEITADELSSPDLQARILSATRAVLGQVGSIRFTIEQVAQEAGVGAATVYRYFRNKEGLLQALSDQFHPRQAAFRLAIQHAGELETDLRRFTTQALTFLYEYRDLAPIYFSSDDRAQDIFKTLRGSQNRTLTSLQSYFDGQVKAGCLPNQNTFDLAAALMGMVIGFAFIKPSYTDQIDPPEIAAQTIVRIFLSDLQCTQGSPHDLP